MAVPALRAVGAGAVITTGSAGVTVPTSGVQNGDFVILQVLRDGTASAVTLGTVPGVESLTGSLDTMTNTQTGDAVLHRQILWMGRVYDATQLTTATVTTGGDDLYCRAYVFFRVISRANASGTACFVGGPTGAQGVSSSSNGTSTTITDAAVTTAEADCLALNFISVNDDNAVGTLTGMTGGTWDDSFTGTFSSATGTDGLIGLQLADMASAGTIDGGSYAMSASDDWLVIGFALRPAPSGNAWSKPLSDTITLSDAVTGKAVGAGKSDTITLSDNLSRVWAISRSFSDTTTLSDVVAKAVGLPRSDSLTLTDTLAKAYGLRPADTITLTDAFSKVWTVARSFADSLTLSDSPSKSVGLSRADIITLQDAATQFKGYALSLSDTVTLTDAIAKSAGLGKSDSLTLTDAMTRAWVAVRSYADTITLSDSISKRVATTIADTIATSDAIGKAPGLAKADTITLADAVQRATGLSRSDSITLSDTVSRGLGLGRSDQISLSDAVNKAIDLARADSITLSDASTPTIGGGGLHLNLADTITLTDVMVKTIGLGKSDILNLADDIAKALNGQFIDGGTVNRVRQIFLNRFGIY